MILINSTSLDEDEKMTSLDFSSPANYGLCEKPFFDNHEDGKEVEVRKIPKANRKSCLNNDAIPACENMNSMMNTNKLEKFLESCNSGYRLVVPKVGECCHTFFGVGSNQAIPNVVISASFFNLCFSITMHSFFLEVLRYLDLAFMQLTLNSYRMIACMFILYTEQLEVYLSV